MLDIFRTPLYKNTSGELLLNLGTYKNRSHKKMLKKKGLKRDPCDTPKRISDQEL